MTFLRDGVVDEHMCLTASPAPYSHAMACSHNLRCDSLCSDSLCSGSLCSDTLGGVLQGPVVAPLMSEGSFDVFHFIR